MSRLRAALRSSLHAASRAAARASTALRYGAAGLLTLDELRRAAVAGWEGFDDAEAVALGWFPWEEALYGPHAIAGRRVLVVGCGSGRDLFPFVDRGCRVVGIEPVEAAARTARELARARGALVEIVHATAEDARPTGVFDVVVFANSSYAYVPQRSSRVGVLARARAALAPEGTVLVSLPAVPLGATSPIVVTRLIARAARSDWRPEQGDVLFDAVGLRFEHRFAPGELAAEARGAGLVVARERTQGGMRLFELRSEAT